MEHHAWGPYSSVSNSHPRAAPRRIESTLASVLRITRRGQEKCGGGSVWFLLSSHSCFQRSSPCNIQQSSGVEFDDMSDRSHSWAGREKAWDYARKCIGLSLNLPGRGQDSPKCNVMNPCPRSWAHLSTVLLDSLPRYLRWGGLNITDGCTRGSVFCYAAQLRESENQTRSRLSACREELSLFKEDHVPRKALPRSWLAVTCSVTYQANARDSYRG